MHKTWPLLSAPAKRSAGVLGAAVKFQNLNSNSRGTENKNTQKGKWSQLHNHFLSQNISKLTDFLNRCGIRQRWGTSRNHKLYKKSIHTDVSFKLFVEFLTELLQNLQIKTGEHLSLYVAFKCRCFTLLFSQTHNTFRFFFKKLHS